MGIADKGIGQIFSRCVVSRGPKKATGESALTRAVVVEKSPITLIEVPQAAYVRVNE